MTDNATPAPAPTPGKHFIHQAVVEDNRTRRFDGRVITRFPPEPNGYLHIGHAKSICLNFGLARDFDGTCHLRFDDTNPTKESVEYVESIMADVHWLGFDWGKNLFYASDYFEQLYGWAEDLIRKGKAYVDDLTADQMREHRGTLTEPGRPSPHRDRSAEENLDLFRRMRAGEFEDGAKTLRAKIDMASPNLNMRDPVMYRIRRAPHHRTENRWCIYPMYDWAHGLSDSIERITHSICTLEYEDHRPLYDWYIDAVGVYHPQQIEFARLNLSHTVMSKRRLLELVEGRHVSGWDDPRMPTIAGLRRRGYTPEAIRDFCDRIGVAKADSMVDMALLEHCIREDLNRRAARVMAVLRPLRLRDRELSRGPGGGDGRGQQSRGSRRRHAEAPLLTRALHRAGRFPRGSAEEVLPPLAGRRGAPALRLLRALHRGDEGSRPPARSPRCAAPTTPLPAAAMPPTAAG